MRRALSLALTAGTVVACSRHHPKPGESIAEVCKLENNGKQVAMSGYLAAPLLMISCTHSCGLQLVPTPAERYGVSLTFAVGAGPRTMDAIPEPPPSQGLGGGMVEIPKDTLRVTTDDGKVATPGDVVRVEGKISVYESDGKPSCSMEPTAVTMP